jgi:hypothetical protein
VDPPTVVQVRQRVGHVVGQWTSLLDLQQSVVGDQRGQGGPVGLGHHDPGRVGVQVAVQQARKAGMIQRGQGPGLPGQHANVAGIVAAGTQHLDRDGFARDVVRAAIHLGATPATQAVDDVPAGYDLAASRCLPALLARLGHVASR